MANFDFIRDLPINFDIEDLIELRSINSAANIELQAHIEIIKLLDEEITTMSTNGMMSSNGYSIIKKFGKEVNIRSLREIRRELLNDVMRLKEKL